MTNRSNWVLPIALPLLFCWANMDLSPAAAADAPVLVPPATPLVACDPYFSIWSASEELAAADTTHWTGRPHRLASLVRVDGRPFRLMGSEPEETPAMSQTSSEVTPTRSIYRFEGAGVAIELTFMTPALPADIDQLSRPVTYVSYTLQATDGQDHAVEIFFSAAGEIAVNVPRQRVAMSTESFGDLAALKIGSVDQFVLGQKGDDLRIDWGYLYLAANREAVGSYTFGAPDVLQADFVAGRANDNREWEQDPQRAGDVAAAIEFNTTSVNSEPTTCWLQLAYDDLYSIEYMHTPLRPYWRRNGLDAGGLLQEAARNYDTLVRQCKEFDRELVRDLTAAGGEEYAHIAALAYRQCLAAGKFVADANGQPLQFCKENNSNGCIATSDVFYPMSPQFLLFGPSMAKSFLVPFMNYAASDRWKFPFAPHDLGTYPKANGQVYGGGERSVENQMPVEESGNLLILMAAVARLEGHAQFAQRYWPQLEQWASYLRDEGYDPDNQLCTDDFAGHLAHNVNLSAKAICGLGAFAQLCEIRGDQQQADAYRATAEEYADRWVAAADDGNHFRLAFDRPGTWSQKYNLVWDKVLGLNLFPEEVFQKEMEFYRQVQNKYGLPLDNRKAYTKLDWIFWTATLTEEQDDFAALVRPVLRFLNETPDRVPMTDWYQTGSGRRVGFKARPVVGGVFMRMLYDDSVWQKWARRDVSRAGGFAPMPRPPKVVSRVAAADQRPVQWRYTTERPQGDWWETGYDDSDWTVGEAGFGTRQTPGTHVRTVWNSSDIWLRREFDVEGSIDDQLQLHVHYDENSEIYINGVLARRTRGYTTTYDQVPMRAEALETIKPTGNVFAVHCRNRAGGQYIDVGMATLQSAGE